MMFQVAGGIIIAVGALGFLAMIGDAVDKALARGQHAREQRRIRKWKEKEAGRHEWLAMQQARLGPKYRNSW